MAMPMLFFPSAITNSIAVMLLPSVAEDQARGQTARIRRTIESTFHYCLLLGIFAAGVFFFFGGSLGTMLFGSPAAGAFLKILAFLSPFLYLNSTLSSILNGLGKTRLHFLENAVSLGVRIGFVLLAVPVLGIRGYLFGLLAGELTACALNLLFLRRLAFFRFRPAAWILKPAAAFALSLGPLPVRLRLDRRSVSPGFSAEASSAASASAARLSGFLSGGMEKIYLTELDNFLRMYVS